MALGMEVGLGSGDFVLDGDPVPPPNFRHVYCDRTVGWIMMPLGTEVGLGPGDFVLDRNPASPERGTPPIFGTRL